MEKLTKREEEIMNFLWDHGPAFVKEIAKNHPEPKPHYNTLSTIVRNLEEKGFIDHENFGTTYRYFTTLSKDEYGHKSIKNSISKYFNNSYKAVVSKLVEDENLSLEDVQQLIDLAKQKKNK